jgi:hypothetical protein
MPKRTPDRSAKNKAYQKAYHARPEQKKARAQRNAARAKLMKDGAVAKGDGKDVDHKRLLSKGGSNQRSNLRVSPRSRNRSRPRK